MKTGIHHKDLAALGRKTLSLEAAAIQGLTEHVDDTFVKVVHLLAECKGRIVVSGIGKSALIAQKIAATFNSTGTPALFMHAADAIHGDLGMIRPEDIVVCISKSGASPEIKVLVPLLKNFHNPLVAIVGNTGSFLALQADYVLDATVSQEACPNNLAPTASTTAQLAMGDALAVCIMELKGFSADDFAKFHPGGTLGKQLYLRVKDLSAHNERPLVKEESSLQEVILEMTQKRLGMTVVSDEKGSAIKGIITDGDLRRMLKNKTDWTHITAADIMSTHPKIISEDELAVNALAIMRSFNITQLIVVKGAAYSGVIHLHDLVKEGII